MRLSVQVVVLSEVVCSGGDFESDGLYRCWCSGSRALVVVVVLNEVVCTDGCVE